MRKKNSRTFGNAKTRLKAVVIEFYHSTASEVYVTGGFVDWKPSALPMIRIDGDRWTKELMLAPGHHEYRLIVDGEWTDDPKASEFVENPFGSKNAVMVVKDG